MPNFQLKNQSEDPKTVGSALSDFLPQLEDYSPTIPDSVTSHYMQLAGFEPTDPRLVRLISLAAQKFVSDVANDAFQHCKTRGSGAVSSGRDRSKEKLYNLTMEDLKAVLTDYGVNVNKPPYFSG